MAQNLIAGKEYYFDNCKDESGIFVKERDGKIFFEPVNNVSYLVCSEKDKGYEAEIGLVGFMAGTYQHVEVEPK